MPNHVPLMFVRIALTIALIAGTYLATTEGGAAASVNVNDKLLHVVAFFVLACLTDFSSPRSGYGLNKNLPLLSYGLLIEIIQFFLPYRTFSLLDLAADAAGVALYSIVLLLGRQTILAWRRALVRE